MRVLVIGSGGREHALAWKLCKSPSVEKVFAAPGNPGMEPVAEAIPLSADQTVELAQFAQSSRIDLTVVGPEGPLTGGIVDYFQLKGLPVFGPTKAAARLEGSKGFAKELMQRRAVPTAGFQLFDSAERALAFLKESRMPVVVKADGLAGGKGAIICRSIEEAASAVSGMLSQQLFGEAGSRVVIEEFLEGEEVSILGVVDGTHVALLAPSQDHKRIFEKDQGPNTGGMGAVSPVPALEEAELAQIRKRIFEPAIQEMSNRGTPFKGVLYAGLMLTSEGPKVLEFNVRFGDPETQAILPRLQTDLAELLLSAVEGKVDRVALKWDPKSCACVVLASRGYPEKPELGREITGLESVAELEETLLFHAGTKREGSRWLTWGGRVLNLVGLGNSLEAALERAYQAQERIHFEGKQFRRDIGSRALKYRERVNK
ncbi:MAG: phosphoribosylamine--glycine ligase [Candidatus Omnitrophica bacterium]|nr:phosphoribosylamine--glycine ligase [Candidatus Omnitrophota bacterium]